MKSVNQLLTKSLDQELLRVFLAVVDTGGFTAAARLLNRTQAAVSQQIRRLEQFLERPLFESPRRTVQLTPHGQVLVDFARRLVALNHEAMACVRAQRSTQRVRIGANYHYAVNVLPALLAEFGEAFPEVQTEVHSEVASVMQKGLGHRYDLLINIYSSGHGAGHLIQRETLHWICSPSASLHNEEVLPLALLPKGSLLRQIAESTLEERRKRWRLVHESSSVASLLACALSGRAISLFRPSSLEQMPVRLLSELEGMPRLPSVDVRAELAPLVSPSTAKLCEFLLARLTGDR